MEKWILKMTVLACSHEQSTKPGRGPALADDEMAEVAPDSGLDVLAAAGW